MPFRDDLAYGYAENNKLYVRSDYFVKDIELRALCEEYMPISAVAEYVRVDDFDDFVERFLEFEVSFTALVEMYARTLVEHYKDDPAIKKYILRTLAGEYGDIIPPLQEDTSFMAIRRKIRERSKIGAAAFFVEMRKDMSKAIINYVWDSPGWSGREPFKFQKFYVESLVAINAADYVGILKH